MVGVITTETNKFEDVVNGSGSNLGEETEFNIAIVRLGIRKCSLIY